MVTIRVRKGEQLREVLCDFGDITFSGAFVAKFSDDRRIPEIAQEWDQVDSVTVVESLKESTYEGLTRLESISGDDPGFVTVRLTKEEDTKDE